MTTPATPKPYVPPEGHLICLGADVPDGWEGRRYVHDESTFYSAKWCRDYPAGLFEVRPVPEPMIAVNLPESVVREVTASGWGSDPVVIACRAALEGQ